MAWSSLRWRALLATAALVLVAGCSSTVGSAGDVTAAASPDTDTWYQLINRNSGKALDVYEMSTADGGDVVQWSDNGGAWQQWRFEPAGDGTYMLVSRHSGKALDVYAWSQADGADVVQWAAHGGANQQWRVEDAGDGHVSLLNQHSDKALEVYAWSQADGANVVQWGHHGGANQQWRLVPVDDDPGTPPGDLVGWATQGGGTTGGGDASPTTVTNASALADAVGAGGQVVRVAGTIYCSDMLDVASNTSVLGEPGATIAGCGLNVSDTSNVIIRNISFRNWDDDAVNVQTSERVWIDHNSFTNGSDGAVDIKRGTDFVTVSWNHVYDHGKSMLLGHSDDNGDQDIGHLRVTYHHNFFDGSGSRHPRVRFGDPVHVFNNYYRGNEYGVASTEGAGVLVEGNYFEDVEDPTLVGYASSGPGDLVERDNVYVGSGSPQSAGATAPIPYAYDLESAGSVPSTVEAGAGAGNITP